MGASANIVCREGQDEASLPRAVLGLAAPAALSRSPPAAARHAGSSCPACSVLPECPGATSSSALRSSVTVAWSTASQDRPFPSSRTHSPRSGSPTSPRARCLPPPPPSCARRPPHVSAGPSPDRPRRAMETRSQATNLRGTAATLRICSPAKRWLRRSAYRSARPGSAIDAAGPALQKPSPYPGVSRRGRCPPAADRRRPRASHPRAR